MNKFEERSKEFYDKKADHYDDTDEGRFTAKYKAALLSTVTLPENCGVLDVGCGNGTLLKMLSEKYRFEGYGTDISEKMVENASRLNPSMHFAAAPCGSIPFSDGAFHVITVCAAFHHFPDPAQFARESCRLLKPKGSIYIAEVYYPAVLRVLCNPLLPLLKAGDVKLYSPKEIIRIFEDNGFEKLSFEKMEHIQIIALQRK